MLYAAFGTVWIVGSDAAAQYLFPEAGILAQTLKGLLFIAITTGVVYWLARRLDASTAVQRAVLEASPVALFSIDLDGRVLTWNRTAEELFGWTEAEIIGKDLPIVPEDRQEEFRSLRERTANRESLKGVEVTRLRKDGSDFHARLSTAPIVDEAGNVTGIMASMEDIGSQKEAELALQASEAQFRALVEGAPDGIFIQSDYRFVYMNQTCANIYGADSTEALLGTPILDHVPPEDHDLVKRHMYRLIEEHKRVEQREQTIITTAGERVPVETTSVPFSYKGRDAALGFVRDIRRRKQAAHERERLTRAIEQTSEAIVITDTDGNIEHVNPAFERTSGFTREEVIGQNPRIQKSHHQDNAAYRDLWNSISNGKIWRGRLVNQHKDGFPYTEDISVTPIFDTSRTIVNYVAVKRDVTHELNLENQLHQAQKMETVGRLAGGVAHDFNNMLSVIQGYTELALGNLPPDSPARSDLGEVKAAAHRSAELTRQLLGFARQQIIKPEIIDLDDTVSNMLKMLERLIGEDITLTWKPARNLWRVKVDPAQIDQILANLTVNARDAIKGPGELIIETANVTLDSEDCQGKPHLVPGDYIQLSVKDDGCGMDEAVQRQAFEPFFTTKGEGEGTGLGLSTVYGIVKQNDGFVYVTSELDCGTVFNIYLPRHDADEMDESDHPKDVSNAQPGNETILLVEDEEALLNLGKRILKKLGYTVLATSSPREAVALAEQSQNTIDLLLTDMVMPEMSGRELWQHIQTISPGTRALFTSGYTEDTKLQDDILDQGESFFIQKPYSATSLSTKLREVLDD